MVSMIGRRRSLQLLAGTAVGAIIAPTAALASFGINVESFREEFGPDDADVINAAIRFAVENFPAGAILNFDHGCLYELGHTCLLGHADNLRIELNASTLRRIDEGRIRAMTVAGVDVDQTEGIEVDRVPENWRIGDRLFVYTGPSDKEVSLGVATIASIEGSRVGLTAPFGDTGQPQDGGRYPPGSTVCKSFLLIEGPSAPSPDPYVNHAVTISGGTIDGNGSTYRNHSWRFNFQVYINGNACRIEGMHFRDTHAECIVGHGLLISKCSFANLGGSAFHTSIHDSILADSSVSIFESCIVQDVNQAGNDLSGHSEGAITFSWNGGRLIVANSEFSNGGAALLGVVGRPEAENTRHDFIITGNLCTGFEMVFAGISHEADRVVVTDNIFVDCGDNGVLFTSLAENPTVVIAGNVAAGNAVLVRGELSQDDRAILAAQEPNPAN